MGLKTIKGVREEKWAEFKGLAVKNRMPMGKLLENMIDEYSKNSVKEFWDRILNGEKILSDKEADELHKTVKSLRRDHGFRV